MFTCHKTSPSPWVVFTFNVMLMTNKPVGKDVTESGPD